MAGAALTHYLTSRSRPGSGPHAEGLPRPSAPEHDPATAAWTAAGAPLRVCAEVRGDIGALRCQCTAEAQLVGGGRGL